VNCSDATNSNTAAGDQALTTTDLAAVDQPIDYSPDAASSFNETAKLTKPVVQPWRYVHLEHRLALHHENSQIQMFVIDNFSFSNNGWSSH
jgi:hypothetical protein